MVAIPTLPPLQLSSGPEITDGRFQTDVTTSFGGDFFNRGSSAVSVSNTGLIGVAGIAALGFLFLLKRGRG